MHNNLEKIKKIVDSFKFNDKVKADIVNVFTLLAEAESEVHGESIDNIHFHEVGTIDAIIDISAVCFLLDKLEIDEVNSSPICTGTGFVRCAHGVLPVPAPATALLLRGIPNYSGDVEAELLTPTGAALLKYFVKNFESRPEMVYEKIGIGFGKKEFDRLNAIRAYLYDDENSESKNRDTVYLLECNIDDMTGEEFGFAFEELLNSGAKDVYLTPVFMKKNRPGQILTVITDEANKKNLIELIFKLTSTIGIREIKADRYVLNRKGKTYHTSLGIIIKKESEGYGVKKSKLEYDDLEKISKKIDKPLIGVKEFLIKNLR